MSDLAIAAITATLRGTLAGAVPAEVTTLPPDKARDNVPSNGRLNLFLYHVTINAAWRNQVIPSKVRPGEQGYPPLALDLHYLLTAYDDGQASETDHVLLGTAMRFLHDRPVLQSADVQRVIGNQLPLSAAHLDRQYEHVALTPETLSVDEMSRLWTTFQSQYRVSASYQASVALLESQRTPRTSLPVLKRGEHDRGPDVFPVLAAQLTGIEYRDPRTHQAALPAAQLGDVIALRGSSLPGQDAEVWILNPNRKLSPQNPTADVLARLKPEQGSADDRMLVALDRAAGQWVAGPLQAVIVQDPRGPKPRRTGGITIGLAPSISDAAGLNGLVTRDGANKQLIVYCDPPIARRTDGSLPDVTLLLTPTDARHPPPPIVSQPAAGTGVAPISTVTFDVSKVPQGEYRVRLRIETVDTLIMRRQGQSLEFDDRQKVVIS